MDREIEMANNIDRYICIDFKAGGKKIRLLTELARKHAGEPMTYLAARSFVDNVRAGDLVFIATGYPVKPWPSGSLFDADGPIGTIMLARAISMGLRAIPVIVCESQLVDILKAGCLAAGLSDLSLDMARKEISEPKRAHGVVIREFPIESHLADKHANEVLEVWKPAMFVSIGKKGTNEKGVHHSHTGLDISYASAKVDALFSGARSRGIPTIGIGDHFINIGFGSIIDEIRTHFPTSVGPPEGSGCLCPCKSGIICATETDVLVASTMSNWGAYGVIACLAFLLKNPQLLQKGSVESRVLNICAANGLLHVTSGMTDGGVDGLSDIEHAYFVELLGTLVRRWL